MKIRSWVNEVRDTKETGDGGGSGGSLLTSSNAGGGSSASKGVSNPSNSSIGENSATGNSSAGKTSQEGTVKNWRLELPPELQEDATLRKYNDVSSLAAAYINAQKLIGSDKVFIPGKHASEQDWNNVYRKLGLPEKIDDYGINFKEGVTIDQEFSNAFKETAYKLGILPKQAQALADWFSDVNTTAETKYMEEIKGSQGKALEGLKSEWGNAYDANLSRAQQVIKNFGDQELLTHLEETGLGNDTKLIKFLAGIGGKLYKESPIVGGDSGGAQIPSPQEAKKTLDSIMANSNHPYFIKDHPGHRSAVKEVSDLFSQMYKE